MSFDEIFDLTAGVYFNFYNIYQLRIVSAGSADGGSSIVYSFQCVSQRTALLMHHVPDAHRSWRGYNRDCPLSLWRRYEHPVFGGRVVKRRGNPRILRFRDEQRVCLETDETELRQKQQARRHREYLLQLLTLYILGTWYIGNMFFPRSRAPPPPEPPSHPTIIEQGFFQKRKASATAVLLWISCSSSFL